MGKITLNFTTTIEDLEQSLLDYSPPRQIMLSIFRGLMFFPAIFILISLLLNIIYGDIKEAISFILPLILVGLAISYPYSLKWINKKMIQPELLSLTTYEFDEDNFIVLKQYISNKLSLTSIVKVYENDKYYLLTYSLGTNVLQNMFFVLPKRAIQTNEQHASLRSLFEKKIGRIENLQSKLTNWKSQIWTTILTIASIFIVFMAFFFFLIIY